MDTEYQNGTKPGSKLASSAALETKTRRNVSKIAEIEHQQKLNRTVGEEIAEVIAAFCGSVFCVYVHIVWPTLWILLNSVFTAFQFDPFPHTFLTLCVA